VELQADRLAGAFAKAANEKGLIDRGDFDEATYTFFSGRDATDKYYQCAHGSGTQRVDAFHTGLKGGVRAAFQ
jgi:predicted metalloprotease